MSKGGVGVGGQGSIEERAGEGVGGDGGSPEGDRSARRRYLERRGRQWCRWTSQVRRGPWRRGSAGAWAGSGTWCCGCCEANRWRRCRFQEVGVEIYRLEDWRDRAVAGLERGVQARQGDLVAETLDAAKRHIGELSMENELLRERARAAEQRRPVAMRRSRR